MTPLQVQLDRIRRRWLLVLAVILLGSAGGAISALLQPTVYTGTGALTTATSSRAPEQDAVLAQGYVELFNGQAYQAELMSRLQLSDQVKLNARTAATSPIIYIEAISTDPTVAQHDSTVVLAAFRDEVNRNIHAPAIGAVEGLTRRLREAQQQEQQSTNQDLRFQLATQINSLQDQITKVTADTTNELKDLQPSAVISATRPNLVKDIALGALGGLVLGVALALLLAVTERRLVSPQDVRENLDLDSIATISDRSTADRIRQLRGLANTVSMHELPLPTVIALVGVHETPLVDEIARALAAYPAEQGRQTVLVDMYPRRTVRSEQAGVVDVLGGGGAVAELVHATNRPGMHLLPAGTPPLGTDDGFALFGLAPIRDMIGQLQRYGNLIVLRCPALLEHPEAQTVCAAAGHTILVVEEGRTRTSDAGEACRLLSGVRAEILGVVIAKPTDQPVVTVWDRPPDQEPQVLGTDEPVVPALLGTGEPGAVRPTPYRRPRPTPSADDDDGQPAKSASQPLALSNGMPPDGVA